MRYDKDLVRQAADGRWPEIIANLGRVDESILDGGHHPCPKCGGSDRFNLNREGTGGAFCNQCFTSRNGDGFATIQWLTGEDFAGVLKRVAEYCGVKPKRGKEKADPAKHLEFHPWSPTLVGLWCLKKKPIKPEAVQAIGGRVATYRGQYTVIAIPVWGPSLDESGPVGWVIYRADGGKLPKWERESKEPEWVKVKLTAGSSAGIICSAETGSLASSKGPVWKTEGPTDLLAILSIDVSSPPTGFTTANGATEKPVEWIVKQLEGKTVYVVHDADKPGQAGATWVDRRGGQRRPGWCPVVADYAEVVKNVCLPFPVEVTHGPDLRDFFAGGGTMERLLELAESADPWSEPASATDYVDEAEHDPHRLARINLAQYETNQGARLIFWRDEWWRYKGGVYRKLARNDLRSKVNGAIRQEFVERWRERQAADEDKPVRSVTPSIVSSAVEAMQSMSRISWSIEMQSCIDTRKRENWISMSNGILDLDAVFAGKPASECLMDHTPNWFSTIKLDYPFEEDADCPLWEEYLQRTFESDSERIGLVQEWAGYLLTSGNPEQKFLALEGEGGNGKTVFLSAMTAMIGEQNISVVPLEKFGGRFDLYGTVGKMANICGDVGEIDRVAEGHLKDFTGGGAMSFDRKGIEPIQCIPTAKLMMSWNSRPRFRDRSQGLWRRMLLVPFDRRVPDAEKIPGMADPGWWVRQGEASGILLWAIRGLYRLRRRGYFEQPRASTQATEDYQREVNPVLEFFDDHIEQSPDHHINAEWLYRVYHHWCEKSGVRPLGNRQFGKEVRKKFPGIERRRLNFDGRPWIYEKIKFSSEEIFSLPTEQGEKFF